MDKNGPIIIIEERAEDQNLFTQIFEEIGLENELLYFNAFIDAQEYLIFKDIKPFIFFSNIVNFNHDKKDNDVDYKTIFQQFNSPCLFFSILFSNCFVIDVFSCPTKSYFVNPYSEEKFKQVLSTIVDYWKNEKKLKIQTKKKKLKQNL
ncbi:hypothetical protein [uncultured Flavobacterium sp.]|uniref:hypothetical protein n=1 Tax=uncultured Flavobacterium sp. TaxID=165435 RepID=UPI0025D942DB|nr:hypothetical protein [uncultured Flavobacterium sp.]